MLNEISTFSYYIGKLYLSTQERLNKLTQLFSTDVRFSHKTSLEGNLGTERFCVTLIETFGSFFIACRISS